MAKKQLNKTAEEIIDILNGKYPSNSFFSFNDGKIQIGHTTDHQDGFAIKGDNTTAGGKLMIYETGEGTANYQRIHIKRSSLSGNPWAIVSRCVNVGGSFVERPFEFRFTTATADGDSSDVNTRVVMIKSTGVGILNVAPQHPLDVTGVVKASGGFIASAKSFFNGDIQVNDNVPVIELSVSNSLKASMRYENSLMTLQTYDSGGIHLNSTSTIRLRGGANVLINTLTDSGDRVNCDGDINATGFKVSGSAGVDGTFTTADSKTVTVSKGIVTAITA